MHYHDIGCAVLLTSPISQDGAVGFAACRIGAYAFASLENTREYYEAGKALKNCLAGCISDQVMGVKHNGEYVAAIEVMDNAIFQMDMRRDAPEEEKKALSKAIEEWAKQNGLANATRGV